MPGYNPDLRDPAGRIGDAALHPVLGKAQALWKAYLDDKFGGDASKAPTVSLYSGGAHRPLDPLGLHVIDQLGKALSGLRIVWGEYDHTQHHEPQPIQSERRFIEPGYPDLESIFGDGAPLYPFEHVDIPEASGLLSRALSDPDSHDRLRLYQQVEQLYVTQVAHIPLVQFINQYLLSTRVAGGYHEISSFGIVALAVWQRIYMAAR